jgi:hypothetical protein
MVLSLQVVVNNVSFAMAPNWKISPCVCFGRLESAPRRECEGGAIALPAGDLPRAALAAGRPPHAPANGIRR